MKIENQKIAEQCWAGISAQGPALLALPNGPADPHQLVRRVHARRGHCVVATRVAPRWRGRHGFTGGLGVAHPVGTPRGSDGGCVGQGEAAGFSPETASSGGRRKRPSAAAFRGGGRALVAGEGVDESCSWRRGQGR
jgi:hypothetical protein